MNRVQSEVNLDHGISDTECRDARHYRSPLPACTSRRWSGFERGMSERIWHCFLTLMCDLSPHHLRLQTQMSDITVYVI